MLWFGAASALCLLFVLVWAAFLDNILSIFRCVDVKNQAGGSVGIFGCEVAIKTARLRCLEGDMT